MPELFGRVSLAGLTSCLIQKPDPYILGRSLERACPEANSGGLPVRSAESGSSASRFVLPLSPSATSHKCHLFPIPHWRCNKRNIDSVLFTSSSFKELEETQLYLAVTQALCPGSASREHLFYSLWSEVSAGIFGWQ